MNFNKMTLRGKLTVAFGLLVLLVLLLVSGLDQRRDRRAVERDRAGESRGRPNGLDHAAERRLG
ncbi:hypothetical protein [Paraburkholderia sp. GAS32]|uniref:hypothetical protein n=1 Tax=Paraburkholderia sp. GAS32 TaxID=3035129 RepID=UPI003D257558